MSLENHMSHRYVEHRIERTIPHRRVRHAMVLLALLLCVAPRQTQAQAWASIQDMISTRHRHGAATGSDGRVYAVGGLVGTQCIASVETYHPLNAGSWSPVASLSGPRCDPGVVFGADGYLYAIGGAVGNISSGLVERYSIATGSWQALAKLNVPRSRPAVAVGPDLKIYAIGGFSQPSGTGIKSIEVYDPQINSWTLLLATAPTPGAYHAVTGLDGNIYAFGLGFGGTWARFDGTSWSSLGSLTPPSTAGFSTVTGPDGLMYLTSAGPSTPLNGTSGVVAYDANGPSTAPPNMVQSRASGAASTAAEGQVFVTGGYRKSSPGEMRYAEAYGPLSAPLFPNAAAWWRFDEPNGLTALDSAGNTPSTFVGNVPHAAARVGKGIVLNGTSQYLQVQNAVALNFGAGDFSIEGWIRWLPGSVSVTPILDKRTKVGQKYQGYHLFVYTGGRLGLQLANGNTYENYVATTTTIKPNQWTHIAVTVDRTASKSVGFYVNGVRDKSFVPLQGSVSTIAPLSIGRHGFSSTYFKGGLDELTLYSRALRWAEIRAAFLAGKVGKQ